MLTVRSAPLAAARSFSTSAAGPSNCSRSTARRLEPDWTGYRLTLPGRLVSAEMVVRVVYVNDYDTTGDGFHQFVDPEDGEEYVYTNFEPYEAHRLFPCFDQPDIKAHLLRSR